MDKLKVTDNTLYDEVLSYSERGIRTLSVNIWDCLNNEIGMHKMIFFHAVCTHIPRNIDQ